jgi:hypothetical protein
MVKKINTEEKKKSSFRNKKEKDIIYPLLQECMNTESDNTWKQIFNNMSRGLCPKGMIIQNGTILGSISKKNNIKYCFLDKSCEDIINNIKNLYSNLINIDSDKNKRSKEFEEINDSYNDYVYMEWRSIKKKAIKDILLQNYCISLKSKYNLTSLSIKSGYETIFNALYLYKTHKNIDVEYNEGKIISIKDIEIEDGHIVNKRLKYFDSAEFDEEDIEEEQHDEDKNTTTSLKSLWESYLITINKG